MHRIDGDAHISNHFSKGNPSTGQPGTQITDDWLNAVQEEICYLIEQAGLTLAKANNTQLKAAVLALLTSTGTSTPETGWNAGPLWRRACGLLSLRGQSTYTGGSTISPGTTLFTFPAGACRPATDKQFHHFIVRSDGVIETRLFALYTSGVCALGIGSGNIGNGYWIQWEGVTIPLD